MALSDLVARRMPTRSLHGRCPYLNGGFMTDTVRHDDKRELSARRGLSSLQKALFGVLVSAPVEK